MTYTFDSFPQLNELVREYLGYCIRYYAKAGMEIKLDDQEVWFDEFRQETTNNYKKNPHFNMEEVRGELPSGDGTEMESNLVAEIIKVINEHLTNRYGEECILDWRKFGWTYIINSYAYAYADWLVENEWETLCEDLKETERKYKQDEIALREAEAEKPLDTEEDYTCVVCLETKNPYRLHPDLMDEDLHEEEGDPINCDWCKSGVWCDTCDELLRKGGKVKCPCCRQKNPKPKEA
jgi:hypothetical protein